MSAPNTYHRRNWFRIAKPTPIVANLLFKDKNLASVNGHDTCGMLQPAGGSSSLSLSSQRLTANTPSTSSSQAVATDHLALTYTEGLAESNGRYESCALMEGDEFEVVSQRLMQPALVRDLFERTTFSKVTH